MKTKFFTKIEAGFQPASINTAHLDHNYHLPYDEVEDEMEDEVEDPFTSELPLDDEQMILDWMMTYWEHLPASSHKDAEDIIASGDLFFNEINEEELMQEIVEETLSFKQEEAEADQQEYQQESMFNEPLLVEPSTLMPLYSISFSPDSTATDSFSPTPSASSSTSPEPSECSSTFSPTFSSSSSSFSSKSGRPRRRRKPARLTLKEADRQRRKAKQRRKECKKVATQAMGPLLAESSHCQSPASINSVLCIQSEVDMLLAPVAVAATIGLEEELQAKTAAEKTKKQVNKRTRTSEYGSDLTISTPPLLKKQKISAADEKVDVSSRRLTRSMIARDYSLD